jgi:catechol 2,3-dioxygenase-like lactoylglutathione lyase family enzyme
VFDHVTIRASDREASERYYELVLGALGIEDGYSGRDFAEWNDFSLAQASDERPVTRGLHIGFVARSRRLVDEFWRRGTEAGYRDDGAPGLRPQYSSDYYGAFVLDPDGNSTEAVHHDRVRTDEGRIDHLWIRVADVAASARFYEAIALYGGFELRRQTDQRAQFAAPTGSFSVVAGTPTENLHIAFPADDDETVDAFHEAACAAGYRDNGSPGERAEYHRGYYCAFVLDPDGTNVEVVHHNR